MCRPLFGKNEYSLSDTSTNAETCPYVADVSVTSTSTFPGCNSSNVLQTGGDEREASRIDFEWYVGDHTIRGGFDREENLSVDASIYSGTVILHAASWWHSICLSYRQSGTGIGEWRNSCPTTMATEPTSSTLVFATSTTAERSTRFRKPGIWKIRGM